MSIDIGLGSFIDYFVHNPWLLIVGFLLYVFIFSLSLIFSGPKPGKNPFSVSHVKPVGDLVTDRLARDRVLKQKFKPAKVPEHLDAVVIGSGMGGLGVASMLSRAGQKVLVLEQHDQAGGCCHTFVEKGFEFDTGVHYVGNMHEGSSNKVLFDQITGGGIEYPKMEEAFDVVALGDPSKAKFYPMMSDRTKFAETLKEKFPKDKEAVDKFMVLLKEARKFPEGLFALKIMPKWLSTLLTSSGIFNMVFKSFAKYSKKTVQQCLDEITDNDDLKAVFTYIFGDYGVRPSQAPFGMHAMVLNHYLTGSYYIRGGPTEIVFQTIPVIEKTGGKVLVQAPVSKILINSKGRAEGVLVEKKGVQTKIYAKNVISDAGLFNTFERLLPKEVATKSCIYPMLSKIGPSLSYTTVFVGLRGSAEELGIKAQNTWSYTRPDQEKAFDEYVNMSLEDVAQSEVPLMFTSFPSTKDPTWRERFPDKSTCLLITLANYKWFERWEDEKVKHRGEDYEGLKNAIGRQMWNNVIQLFPKLEGKDEYFEVGSPLSNRHYLGVSKGEMYGADHVTSRFSAPACIHLRPKTDIPGLYLTGQDTLTAGLTAAIFSAMLCTSSILHRNLYKDLENVRKELKKNA